GGAFDRSLVVKIVDEQQKHLAEKAKHEAMAREAERLRKKFGADGVEGCSMFVSNGVVIVASSMHLSDEPYVSLALPKLKGSPAQIEAVLTAIQTVGLLPKKGG